MLCLRLGVYDDSLLPLGARLVRAGQLPYRDFYTHYGPLGFGLLAVPMKWVGNPGVALRLAQGFGLPGVTLLFGLTLRRLHGTSQAQPPGNPVYLFLLSRRLPYARWFQYDPGLQSSPQVQAQMIEELATSDSTAAVAWRSESFAYDDVPERAKRSAFDIEADLLYPLVAGRFGNYEVRAREGAAPPR